MSQPTTPVILYGYHTCLALLNSPQRPILRLLATEARLKDLSPYLENIPIIQSLTPAQLTARLPQDAIHQCIAIETTPLPSLSLTEIEADRGPLLVLDQISDPHNIGAIIRTAAAFNVSAILLTERHTAPSTSPIIAKTASGGTEFVPLCRVSNLARALGELNEKGYYCIGLDSDSPLPFQEALLSASTLPHGHHSIALVLGAEGQGLRRLTREKCDLIASLDLPGPIKSLNVSCACAMALTLMQSHMFS